MSRIRKTVFWAHLAVGILVGLVVLMMSATGVLLTYERQILRQIDDAMPTSQAPALAADELIKATLRAAEAPPGTTVSLRYSASPDAPVRASIGRNQQFLLDPGTGVVLRAGPSSVATFFSTVTRLHRWLALEGDARKQGRAVTGYANLGFLFLLISGIYLWLPRSWHPGVLRNQVMLKRTYASGKARDWSWHHVFAFWGAIPLLAIILTATVFYFPWANAAVYGFFGESVPDRRGSSSSQPGDENRAHPLPPGTIQQKLAMGLSLAESAEWEWRSLTLESARRSEDDVTLTFDETLGGTPQAVHTLTFDKATPVWSSLSDRSAGTQARFIVRFLHTGEVLGLPGQTLAGLASLGSCLLVWSGLALAWRRLIRPVLIARSRSRKSPG